MQALSEIGTGHPTLLFFHLAKTGGTSLARYFQSLASSSSVQAEPSDVAGLESALDGDRADFVSGHYPVASWLSRIPPSWRTMLVLRHPLHHLLSSYWHLRTHAETFGNAGMRELIRGAREGDLGALLDARPGPHFEAMFDNPQTRFILAKPSGPLDAADHARARALLGALTHVGVTEQLDGFAQEVAASLPWAAGWREATLPRVMVNPRNQGRIEDMPQPLLRRLLAATELDGDLYARVHGARRATVAPRRPELAAPSAPMIPLADLVRVSTVEIRNARIGAECRLDTDVILLHAPDPSIGAASVMITDAEFNGQSEIAGRLLLAHSNARPVRFDVEITQGAGTVAAASYRVEASQPLRFSLGFAPIRGRATVTLRTEMVDRQPNHYAWAKFVGVEIR